MVADFFLYRGFVVSTASLARIRSIDSPKKLIPIERAGFKKAKRTGQKTRSGDVHNFFGTIGRMACVSTGWTMGSAIADWIVQSIIPCFEDFEQHSDDPELISDPAFRSRQRGHLAILMESVVQMLRVRDTHQVQERCDGRVIDLLVFPELAIHPHDIEPIIVPFIRTRQMHHAVCQVYTRRHPFQGPPPYKYLPLD